MRSIRTISNGGEQMIKVAFYDTKAYDKPSFEHNGRLIDAEALLEGIKARKIGAACLDVYEEEALNNIAETTVNNILSYFEKDGICDNELCYRCGNIEHCKKERKERCF